MPNNRPNPAEDIVREPPNKARDMAHGTSTDNSNVDEPSLGEPSLEDVVERLKRIRPEVLLGTKLSSLDLAGQCIGRYKIQKIVGRGAFGIVYLALDQQLGREVALKVPRPDVLFDGEKLRRFESEAATAATLEHRSIIPIYEADLTGPTPYIASAYCAGPNLGEWLANHKTSIPIEQAARFVIKLAEAVDYAHRQGVLHRDLKPSNIMLEPCREDGMGENQLQHFEPRLTDFGLAKLLESDRQETRSSIMLGTPRYMAPEQFDRQLGTVGVQSDVYALGAILYELLLGQPVAEGSSHMELMLSILERRVVPPSRVRSSVTPTLEAICLKALEKRPQNRYLTSSDLAKDLGRYLRGEPTLAKPLGLPSRVVKWIGLNPLAAGLLSVVSISVLGFTLGVFWHNFRLSEQLEVSDILRIESTESANRLLRASYVSDMHLAQQAILSGRFSEARSRLLRYQSGRAESLASDFAWRMLNDQLERTITPIDLQGSLTSLASSDRLKTSVAGSSDGKLQFFDSTSGVQLAVIQAHEGNINAIAFAVDGTSLVSGGDDGMLCVWNVSPLHEGGDIKLVARKKAHEDDLLCLAVSPNGKWIASGSADNTVRLWNFEDLEPSGELTEHTDWVRALDFSPDSTSLASASQDGTIRLWDLETKKEVDRFLGHDMYVLCVKYHPTEPLLVSGGKDRSIRFWDLSTGQQLQQINAFNGWIRSLCFSQDGNKLAVVAEDPRVMLFQRDTDGQYRREKNWLTDHNAGRGICFVDSDRQIISASAEGASIWSYDVDLANEHLSESHGSPNQIVSLPDSHSLILATSQSAQEIDSRSGSLGRLLVLRTRGQDFLKIAISSAGTRFAYLQNVGPKELGQWNLFVRNASSMNRQLVHKNSVSGWNGADISPSGQFVASASSDLKLRVWQAPDFRNPTIVYSPTDRDFDNLFIDDTGKLLILHPHYTNDLFILDVETARPIEEFHDILSLHSRSPEGHLLSIAMSDYSLLIYNTQLRQVEQKLPNHEDPIIGACFSPTESLVATMTNKGEIALWALDTGEMLMQFQAGFRNPMTKACLCFASDGNALFAAGGIVKVSEEGRPKFTELRVWRVP
ncbi:MAG: protein kinase [Planctomycetes bacterium]|nr:protein kinase [Planctomycetota bacterium]